MMRRAFLLAAAVLAVATACRREYDLPDLPDAEGAVLDLYPSSGTKAAWKEGDAYITWQDDDELGVYFMEEGASSYQVKAGTPGATRYTVKYSTDRGCFSTRIGALSAGLGVYAVYPASAAGSTGGSPDRTTVTVPSVQKPTRTRFDLDADILVSRPAVLAAAVSSRSNYNADLVFAHLSGFLKVTFDDPGHADEIVQQAILTSAAQPLSGPFTYHFGYPAGTEGAVTPPDQPAETAWSIQIDGGGTPLKDFTAWFATMPQRHEDLVLTLYTPSKEITYSIGAATIASSKITVRRLTEPAAVKVTSVVLQDKQMWEFIPGYYATDAEFSMFSRTAVWTGTPEGDTSSMTWDLTFNPDAVSLYAHTMSDKGTGYKVYNVAMSGSSAEARMTSRSSFEGIWRVDVKAGLYRYDNVATETTGAVYLVDGASRRCLGTFRMTTDNSFQYTGVSFAASDAKGQVELVFNEGGAVAMDGSAVLTHFSINQKPVITTEVDELPLRTSNAVSGVIPTTIDYMDTFTLKVLDDAGGEASWFHATFDPFAHGITWQADANEGGPRSGCIELTAVGLTAVTKRIPVSQPGHEVVERTYAFTMSADGFDPGDYGTDYTVLKDYDRVFTATALDGSGKTRDVHVSARNLHILDREVGGEQAHLMVICGDPSTARIAVEDDLESVDQIRFQLAVTDRHPFYYTTQYAPILLYDTPIDWTAANATKGLALTHYYGGRNIEVDGETYGDANYEHPVFTVPQSLLKSLGKTDCGYLGFCGHNYAQNRYHWYWIEVTYTVVEPR